MVPLSMMLSWLLLGSTGGTAAVTLDFEDLENSEIVTDQYRSDGVLFQAGSFDPSTGTWSPIEDVAVYITPVTQAMVARSGTKTIRVSDSSLNPTPDDIIMTFVVQGTDEPAYTSSVTLLLDAWTAESGPPPDPYEDWVTLYGLDAHGQIVVQSDPVSDMDVTLPPLHISHPQIHYAVVDFQAAADSTDWEEYDDLTFALPTAVPETRTQPDLWIKYGGDWRGDDVYNGSGDGQTARRKKRAGETAKFWVRLYNDGDATEAFFLQGPPGDGNWNVEYYNRSKNVTERVTGPEGWKRAGVPPGGVRYFRIEVTPGSGLAAGEVLKIKVQAVAQRAPAQRDTIKAVTKVKEE